MARSSEDDTPPAESTIDPRSTGRITHDERGNAVWNWSKGNNGTSTVSTSQMLRQLDLTSLQVEGEAPPAKGTEVKQHGSGYGPGYNPYDRAAPVRLPPPLKKPPTR